ncbi:MAG: 50S ribosomal protein L11 methyltransferase [Syntrophales bacterium]|nr:50S ribosomal protein L11 methyltransferase [Syntrophales bacterium]
MAALFYRLSPRLVLCSREDPYAAGPGEQVLLLASGQAFPLGHPSTRLSLELLRDALVARPVKRLLDLGCGTGVLGLAAMALGVPRVVGADISLAAVQVTRENARTHHLTDSLEVVQGSGASLQGPFDLVAANLPYEVQVDQAPELDRLAGPRGRLLLAGFREHQEDFLLEFYRQRGRSLVRRLEKPFHHPELPGDLSFTWVAWLLAEKGRTPERVKQDF